MTRHVLGTASLILMVATAALGQGTRLGEFCDLGALGAKETKTFLAFDQELRAALSKQDTAAMALLVKFPLRIHTEQGNWSLDDPAALQSRFQEVFPPTVRNAVLKISPADVACNYEGARYDGGDVWVNLGAHGYAVQVVNLPATERQQTGVRRLEFACQTEKHRIVVDESALDHRYRVWNKPRPATDKPDMEIVKGTENFEGRGPCAYPIWTFKNAQTTYSVEGAGCSADSNGADTAKGKLSVLVNDKVQAQWACY